jgi:hypothetical protein
MTLRGKRAVVVGAISGVGKAPASSTAPAYFILLEWSGSTIALIRDFRYVPYISADARFEKR